MISTAMLTPVPEREAAPERQVRRSRAWAVAMVVTVVSLLAGYLGLPFLAKAGTEGTPAFSSGAAVTVPGYDEHGVHILGYQHGAEFTVGVTLVNRSPVPLDVTDVRLTDEPRPLVETVGVKLDGRSLPVSLAPGESVRMELRARFGNCRYYHEREMQNMTAAMVTGELLGRSVSVEARFDRDFLVHSPMIVSCPERTLVRGDDLRR